MEPFDPSRCGADFRREFAVQRELGRGASGVVLLARQVTLDRWVAIKYFAAGEGNEHRRFLKRFLREAPTLVRLQHPGILRVFGTGLDGTSPYLVEEYLEGKPLDLVAKDGERCSPPFVAAVGVQLAAALSYAHGCGVVHRDVKPANAFVAADDRVTLLDFGLAHDAARTTALTRTGAIVGTPLYMAPELLLGATATPASDAFALGVLLFELCCGIPPYGTKNLAATLARASTPPPPVASMSRHVLPTALADVVDALLRLDPASRPSLAEVATRLAATDGPPRRAAPTVRSRRPLVALAAALALGAFLVLPRPPPAPEGAPVAWAGAGAVVPRPELKVIGHGDTWIDVEVSASGATRLEVRARPERPPAREIVAAGRRAGLLWRARLEPLVADRRHRLRAVAAAGHELGSSYPASGATSAVRPRLLLDLATAPTIAARSGPAVASTVALGPVVHGATAVMACLGTGLVAIDCSRAAVVWRRSVAWAPVSLAVTADGLVVAGDDRRVRSCSWDDGAERWCVTFEGNVEGNVDGSLVASTRGVLVPIADIGFCCLEPSSGRQVWFRRDTLLAKASAPTADGRLWVRARHAGLTCLDLATGEELEAPQFLRLGRVAGRPLPWGNDVVAALTTGLVIRAGRGGALRFTTRLEGVPVATAAAGQLVLVQKVAPHELVAIDAADGAVAWRTALQGEPGFELRVDRDRVYVNDQAGDLTCLAVSDGALLWSLPRSAAPHSHVVPIDAGILWADREGRLWTLDAPPHLAVE